MLLIVERSAGVPVGLPRFNEDSMRKFDDVPLDILLNIVAHLSIREICLLEQVRNLF
jgi:hypothetical protein